MIVRVELSPMSGCTVCTVVISGDDVCCSVTVTVWYLALWLVCFCLVLCGPSC